jgi:hypothetical protein
MTTWSVVLGTLAKVDFVYFSAFAAICGAFDVLTGGFTHGESGLGIVVRADVV